MSSTTREVVEQALIDRGYQLRQPYHLDAKFRFITIPRGSKNIILAYGFEGSKIQAFVYLGYRSFPISPEFFNAMMDNLQTRN